MLCNIDYRISAIQQIEVWSLAEVKNYLRVSHDYDDEMIKGLILSAIETAEQFTGLNIHKKKISCSITRASNKIELKYVPILTLLRVEQLEKEKKIDVKDKFGFLDERNLKFYLADFLVGSSLEIEYETGFEKNIPRTISHGMLMHIALMYDNPESNSLSGSIKELYLPYRYLKI